MPEHDPEPNAVEEQPADAQTQLEAQATRDSAEVELASVRAELAEARSARAELVEARAQLREAALKYRDARLAAAPHIPADLVRGETIDEIDRQLEAAQKVVARLRQELAAEVRKEEPPARIPVGSPARRAPELSALSPTEKIKLGLQQLAER